MEKSYTKRLEKEYVKKLLVVKAFNLGNYRYHSARTVIKKAAKKLNGRFVFENSTIRFHHDVNLEQDFEGHEVEVNNLFHIFFLGYKNFLDSTRGERMLVKKKGEKHAAYLYKVAELVTISCFILLPESFMTLPVDNEGNIFINMSKLPKWVRRIVQSIQFYDNRATLSFYPYHQIIDPSQVSPRFISIVEENAWDSFEKEIRSMETAADAPSEEPRAVIEVRTSEEPQQASLVEELDALVAAYEQNGLPPWEGEPLDDLFHGG